MASESRLQTRVPIVAFVRPIILRALSGVGNRADALYILDAVLNGNHQTKWGAVCTGKNCSVHFIAEQCLGVYSAGSIESDEIRLIGRLHADIGGTPRIRRELRGEVGESCARPA